MTEKAANTKHTKLLIIGSGPAGYTAAVYAARAGLQPVIVAGMEPGGQMTTTTDVENYPGFENPVQGPWLMDQMKKQAENFGTEMINDTITDVDFSGDVKKLTGASGASYTADAVIIATGAQAKWLGTESEEKFKGYGVSACATCDGFFYKGKEVVIVGGGNTAVEEALFLTQFVDKVTLIHRGDSLRAEKIMQDRLFDNDKIEVMWNTELDEVLGVAPGTPGADMASIGVTGVKLRNNKTGAVEEKKVAGVFIAIGHAPATKVFDGHVDLDKDGYVKTKPDSTETNIAGVFAAGDVKDRKFKQAVTAAGMGCMAALEADQYLAGRAAKLKLDAANKNTVQRKPAAKGPGR